MKTSPIILNEALKEFDSKFELDGFGESTVVQDKVKQFLTSYTARLIDEMEKAVVVEERKYASANDDAVGVEHRAFGWNSAREEILRRFQAFKRDVV